MSAPSDEYKLDNWDRVTAENARLRRALEVETSNHAITRARFTIHEIERQERESWLARKVKRQTKHLAKLQEVRGETA